MTPDEVSVLQGVGRDWVHGFIAISHHTFWMTVYAALVIRASFILFRKDRRNLRTYIFFSLAIFTMFAIALILWTLDLTTFILEGKLVLMRLQPGDSISDKLASANKRIFSVISAQDALYAYMSLLGDAIIIHRYYPLAVATVLLTYCVAVAGSEIVLGSFEKPAFCKNVQEVTYIMPMATTAVTTLMIGHTAWKHWSIVAPHYSTGSSNANSSTKKQRSQVERILILLVESGFFYFLFFLIQVIGDIPIVEDTINSSTTLTILMMMFDYSSSTFVVCFPRFPPSPGPPLNIPQGIYPTMIVILAHSKHAVIDEATVRTDGSVGQMSSIHIGQLQASNTESESTFPVGLREEIELGESGFDNDSRSQTETERARVVK
ncbi:hypothetical protein B0H14DRAFT_3737909 [Mycena olivaceomarginata]|nr:hypothetical protein B0H14DRAFT_3737909 [Mycena olivaceomarginata]